MASDPEFRKKIEGAINSCSRENGSDTPDFILAEFLGDCLEAFDRAVAHREKWYGRPIGVDRPDAPQPL